MQSRWTLELLSWIVIILVAISVMAPIYLDLSLTFPYYLYNVMCIAVFLYFTKHIFLLRHAVFSHRPIIKFVLLLLCIPLFLYLIDGHYEVQRYFDEDELYRDLQGLDADTQISLSKYIRYEVVFFAVSALIVTLIFPIRLIVSEWRIRNRGTI